jgi:L-ascorbate metabolism protein UlaG (beta-lactamase superfamily)
MSQAPFDQIRITYIGGPTALIEIGQLRLLTDPTFDPAGSRYVDGPVKLSKQTDPVLTVSELGAVDAILPILAIPNGKVEERDNQQIKESTIG